MNLAGQRPSAELHRPHGEVRWGGTKLGDAQQKENPRGLTFRGIRVAYANANEVMAGLFLRREAL